MGKKQLEAQGQTDVKLDNLISMLGDINPNVSAKSVEVKFSASIVQNINQDPSRLMFQRITTRKGAITSWPVVSEEFDKGEVLSEAEYNWLGDYVGKSMDADHGEVNAMEFFTIFPKIEATLA